ncbi:hypothetical protein KTN00_03780 [Acinetobacter soli]|uniref:hypothetical protein n=1 Tax=Acinetobacter soli TaxID=487316 RepID=UPI001C463E8C|nr:hypothetical protein [Acinetobacter soli]MBV6550137.1 hypothetical protein [Acinetobacter soli]MBV6550146.1 hypothetical protein [Acinetobacter soli]
MNKEQALEIYKGLVAEAEKQPNESMFDFHQGRADGFILSLMYQNVITHTEYSDLADQLLKLRFGYVE